MSDQTTQFIGQPIEGCFLVVAVALKNQGTQLQECPGVPLVFAQHAANDER
jgi:hypothetical protein